MCVCVCVCDCDGLFLLSEFAAKVSDQLSAEQSRAQVAYACSTALHTHASISVVRHPSPYVTLIIHRLMTFFANQRACLGKACRLPWRGR